MPGRPPDGSLERIRRSWERFWYRPESSRNLAVARMVLAATALWIVLSRFDLPSVLTFPAELWAAVPWERRVRFLMVFDVATERWLYGLLHLTLVLATIGIWPRTACFLSGLLLYHFAPFETVLRTPNPYLRGLTVPTLGLLILAFAPAARRPALGPRDAPVPVRAREYRWPLALIEVLVSQLYLFAGYAKLVTSGPAWVSASNVRGYLLVLNQALAAAPPASLGYAVARSTVLCAAIAWGGILLELGFPLVLVWRPARVVLPALALVFHVANSLLFRISFPALPLLLLFVDWDVLLTRLRSERPA